MKYRKAGLQTPPDPPASWLASSSVVAHSHLWLSTLHAWLPHLWLQSWFHVFVCNFYTVMSTICRQRQSSLNCSHSLTQCKVDGQRLACDCMQFVTCPALYLHGRLFFFFCPVVGGALLLFGLLMINNRFRMMLLICVEWTWISSLTQKQQWKSKALSVSCINTHILLWSRSRPCEVKFTAAAPRAEKRKWFLPSLLQEPGSSLLTSSFITFLIVMVINWHYW